LETIEQRGYSGHDVFRDWLDLMLYALQQRDDPYLEIVNRYDNDRDKGEREIDYFTQGFGQLQQGMAATDADLLGVVYESYGMASDAFGQYFTPHNVCEATTEMQMGVAGKPDTDDRMTIGDPACGSGRMLVMAAQRQPDAVFVGQDKDATCARMAALNLCLFNVDGYVVHGDSLRVEQRRVWQTAYSAMGGSVRERDPDEVEIASAALEAAAEQNEDSDREASELQMSQASVTEF